MIAGVVLAAGLARRMREAKLLLDLGGKPLIRRTVERVLAGGIGRAVVVVGPEHAGIREALSGLPIALAINPEPAAGQGSSIRIGIAALHGEPAGALIALGDQPTIPAGVIAALLTALVQSGKAIVAPVYRQGLGTPVLFGAGVFPELAQLSGDRGARLVVERDPERVALVKFDLPMPADVDTPEDYERLKSEFSRRCTLEKP